MKKLSMFTPGATLITFGVAILAPATLTNAAPIGNFNPSSLSITEITGPVWDETNSSFNFVFDSLSSSNSGPFVTGTSNFGYLNLLACETSICDGETEWLIQDEPIPLISSLINEENHFWFSPSTTDFSNIFAIFNDTPFGSEPTVTTDWSLVTGAGFVNDWGSLDPQGQNAPTVATGTPPPTVQIIEGYLRGGVPDIKQLHNECGPTATTNSLLWLIKKYNLPTDKLPKKANGELDEQEILKQLAKAMSPDWKEKPIQNNDRGYDGLFNNELLEGKKKYFEQMMLPLVSKGGQNDPKANGASAFQFIKDELKAGEDVEFLLDWPAPNSSHWVTVVGFIDRGKDDKTLIVHDPLPQFQGNQYWKLKDDGTFTNPQGKALWAVSESVKVP